jgi:hypothetical protein
MRDYNDMRPFWQTEWQNIRFSDIVRTSETELAGAEFYNAFYRELFNRYASYDALDEKWRRTKREMAEWIRAQLPGHARVLSIGCGLGFTETCLHRDGEVGGMVELHVSDYASDALRWLREQLPADRIHGGTDGEIDDGRKFDFIYLSAVDYALARDAMVELLTQQRQRLAPRGACVLISASYVEENPSMPERLASRARAVVSRFRQRGRPRPFERGQFWGWKRSRTEYRELVQAAGYPTFDDGFITTKNQRTYFIRARI